MAVASQIGAVNCHGRTCCAVKQGGNRRKMPEALRAVPIFECGMRSQRAWGRLQYITERPRFKISADRPSESVVERYRTVPSLPESLQFASGYSRIINRRRRAALLAFLCTYFARPAAPKAVIQPTVDVHAERALSRLPRAHFGQAVRCSTAWLSRIAISSA